MKETYSHISYPFAKLDIIIYNYIKFNKWVTDMGMFLSKTFHKDYKAQERNYIGSVSLISST